jgi:hypothetical protein
MLFKTGSTLAGTALVAAGMITAAAPASAD